MNDQQLIKSLKRSLKGAGFKIEKLQEEIEVLKAESKSNEPMYSERIDHIVREYVIMEEQFKDFMEKSKSFWFWIKYRFNIK